MRMEWKTFWNDSPQVRDPDPCRQVGRTFRNVGFSEGQLAILVERLLCFLDASPDKTLLDLACGNGLVTTRLAPRFRHVTAVDFSAPLIEVARSRFSATNVEYLLGDAVVLDGVHGPFDCALISAAVQHLTIAQLRSIFQQLKTRVRPGGCIVLGDVPDAERKWNFYRGVQGRSRYGVDLLRRKAIIGSWWRSTTLLELALECGWTLAIHYQTPDLPNYYFRFDAVLRTPDAR